MKLPKNINPCPIVDALLEVRFTSTINANAVFGLIYSVLQKDFQKVETLPILQLPDVVRASDPNLKYKPYYKISNENFVIQIGPDVILISSFPRYLGWEIFSKIIFDVLTKIEQIGIINVIERIGIRYINFFENNIFEKINLKVSIGSNDVLCKNTIIRTEIEQGEYSSTLQLANNAIINGKNGSIIDIDTFVTKNLVNFFSKKNELINAGHLKEKELFYSLLSSEFLSTLNPTY
ncbi:TIGR04255 family protein [Bacteroidales bacterium MB20-C3-3]|nr:TIGR04255 family protein [Bacteroidales bacterium MB20-C3-3]